MAYDVDRAPGAWVTRQAARTSRLVWLSVGLLGIVAVAAVWLAASGQATLITGADVLVSVLALKVVGDLRVDAAVRWRKGARAERAVGKELNKLRREGFVLMHDVEQQAEGNIDHIVSGANGVYLVETKWRR